MIIIDDLQLCSGDTFNAEDKLSNKCNYMFICKQGDDPCREIVLYNLTECCETRVEKAWFGNRKITSAPVWIPCSERLPTEADADERGNVYIWYASGKRCRTHWENIKGWFKLWEIPFWSKINN